MGGSKISKEQSGVDAYAAAIGYALTIGFSFLFVKISLTVSNAFDILAYRFTAAFLIAVIFSFVAKNPQKVNRKDLRKILPIALLYPTCFFLFQVIGLEYITSSEAGILQATIPIFTLILASILIKEHATNLMKLSILLSIAGVFYIFLMNGINVESYNWAGIMLILLSTLSIAMYNVLARSLTKQYPLFTLTYYMSFIGFITFNAIAIGSHLFNNSLHLFMQPVFNLKFIAAILYLGVLASFGTSFLSNYALHRMEASRMSVFNNISILITIFAGIVFLHESIYYYHYIGAIVIIAGVFGTNYKGRKGAVAHKENVT